MARADRPALPSSVPPALADLIEFHAPLAETRRECGGVVTLLTPSVNVLALNASFLPLHVTAGTLAAVGAWHDAQRTPVLLAALVGVPGAQDVAVVRVGAWNAAALEAGPRDDEGRAGEVVVEQISRLHLSAWAEVLTRAHGTPQWAPALARHLSGRLETERAYVLLMAYRAGVAVGALLWQARGLGGAAHLWGALDRAAGSALLRAAAALGHGLTFSATGPAAPREPLQQEPLQAVYYQRL